VLRTETLTTAMASLVLVTKDVDLWTLYFVDNFASYLDA
jgi:hypothetical protein